MDNTGRDQCEYPFLKKMVGKTGGIPVGDADVFSCDRMVIIIDKHVPDSATKAHTHDNYEFIVPIKTSLAIDVENQHLDMVRNEFFPINPGQLHRSLSRPSDSSVMVVFIGKNHLHEVARSMYGQKDIYFENSSIQLDVVMQNRLHLFIEESRNHQAGYQFILDGLSVNVAIDILRHARSNLPPEADFRLTGKESINRAIDFLWDHYNTDFTLIDMAKTINLSANQLIRSFKHETGKTPFEYLSDIKLEKAKAMLRVKQNTVSEVCFSCGFRNHSHFTVVFKRKTGVTPSAYRNFYLGTDNCNPLERHKADKLAG